MQETISASDVYDKDLNFLFGAGASSGLFPTLALQIKNEQGAAWTLEEVATRFEASDDQRYVPLFMHYYNTCIRPAQVFNVDSATGDETRERVVANYRAFLKTVLQILQRRKALERRCNLFTTNYDGCFPLIADEILREGSIDFLLNDGARGFRRRYLQARNFNTYLCQTGIFERHQASIPQINLIHVHGSVYWRKSNANIVVDYELQGTESLLDEDAQLRISDERDQPFRDRDRGFRQRDRSFRERDRADRKAGLALRMTSTTRAMLAGFGRREHARAPDEHAHDQGRFTT